LLERRSDAVLETGCGGVVLVVSDAGSGTL